MNDANPASEKTTSGPDGNAGADDRADFRATSATAMS